MELAPSLFAAPKQVAHAAPEPMSVSAVLASAGVHAILVPLLSSKELDGPTFETPGF